MTSEQYPGFPPNGVPNGVPPQTPNGVPPQASESVPSAYSNQGTAPQNQPAAPNGSAYQAPPGYAAANGQLTATLVKKTRRGLVIGIVASSLVLVLAITLFILLFSGARSVPGGSKAASEADKSDVTGLTQSEKEPELIGMGNTPGKDYIFAGDTLVATDYKEVWAFSLSTQKEVWRSADPIEELDCDSPSDTWFYHTYGSFSTNSNYALLLCSPNDETESYVVIPAKDGKVATSGKLESEEDSTFAGILKDDSLVTCENNELIHYAGVASTEKKLWSQPVKYCRYYFFSELDSGWIKMLRDGPGGGHWNHFWGDLFNLQDGSQPPAARAFADTIEDLDEDAYSFTPLGNGNFAVEYYTKAGEDEDSKGHVVLLDAKGKPISQTYDDAFITSSIETGVVLLAIDDPNDFKVTKNIRLDPATGKELWTNQDAKIGMIIGTDKQFIWGQCEVQNKAEDSEYRTAVLDTNTGKTVMADDSSDAPWIYRTENGFITEVNTDTETKLKAHVWKDGKFTELWSKTYKNTTNFADYQHRLYAISNSSDAGKGGIVGYLGYESGN
ncbi:proline-rich domain-containing protein [uncultured Mobiluncus sp.]|uniref:proline-rich domain-containing protein n=1 Tax=uncultured Mobiluncus sp. TaxID=293425 RepID=UPI00288BD3B1|nr:proline-rich domain-containing protein [uncultured Mobiluncus sp.]